MAQLKNRIQISNSVDKLIWEQFQKVAKQTRIPMARLLDEAMADLIAKYEKKDTH
ncbi:MAG: ribbon-helix-helix domain-containing protein [Bacillota bacterium]